MSFLITPLTNLHDEYIDRSKLTEQNKPVEHIVRLPHYWSEQQPDKIY